MQHATRAFHRCAMLRAGTQRYPRVALLYGKRDFYGARSSGRMGAARAWFSTDGPTPVGTGRRGFPMRVNANPMSSDEEAGLDSIDLAHLLAPLSVDDFINDYWGKKPYVGAVSDEACVEVSHNTFEWCITRCWRTSQAAFVMVISPRCWPSAERKITHRTVLMRCRASSTTSARKGRSTSRFVSAPVPRIFEAASLTTVERRRFR